MTYSTPVLQAMGEAQAVVLGAIPFGLPDDPGVHKNSHEEELW